MGIGQLCAVPAAWGDLCSAFEGHHHFDKITWHSNPAGHAKLLGFDHQAMQACLCKEAADSPYRQTVQARVLPRGCTVAAARSAAAEYLS